jgi:hypothetical protein
LDRTNLIAMGLNSGIHVIILQVFEDAGYLAGDISALHYKEIPVKVKYLTSNFFTIKSFRLEKMANNRFIALKKKEKSMSDDPIALWKPNENSLLEKGVGCQGTSQTRRL